MNKMLMKEKSVEKEKECWERKRMLGKEKGLSHIWAKPGPDLG